MCHAFNQYLVVAVKNKGLYGSKPYTP